MMIFSNHGTKRDREKPAFIFKRCIGELMRTGYCPPNIVLVVDKINIENLPPPNEKIEAFRLFLGDGEYLMQGTRPKSKNGP